MVFFVGLWPHLFASKSHKDFWRKIVIQQQPDRECNRCSDDHFQLKDCNFANFGFATESLGRNIV
jgi:hypothetical protein